MPKSYSKDLWWRIVFMISLQGKPISQVAREMYVSHSTVKRFLYRYYTTGKWEQYSKTMALIDCWMTLSSYLMYNPSQQARYLLEEVKELYDATGSGQVVQQYVALLNALAWPDRRWNELQ